MRLTRDGEKAILGAGGERRGGVGGQWMWPVYRIVVGTHSTRWQSDERAGARPPHCRHAYTRKHVRTQTHALHARAHTTGTHIHIHISHARPLTRSLGAIRLRNVQGDEFYEHRERSRARKSKTNIVCARSPEYRNNRMLRD